jgi:hypothetical protein
MFSLIRARITDFFAVIAGLLAAVVLHGFPWGLDVALCVAYTVKVLGLGLTDKRAKVFSSDHSRSWLKIILMHAGFLVAVEAIVRVGALVFPVQVRTSAHEPRPINWGLLLVICAIYALAYSEVRLLFHAPKTKSSTTKTPTGGFEPMAEQVAFRFSPAVAMAATPEVAMAAAAEVATAPLIEKSVEPEAAAESVFEKPASRPAIAAGPPVGDSIAAGVYSAAESDEHEAFLLYMHQKEREFRKPGVSVKEEYEQWRAHRAAVLSGIPLKKKSRGLFG